ncbi:tetratricopeptide repeat protein [candidate division KSB1 bacterium]|nr:tetratricopeptide repeat protein [candidate division KSB1 bacterium]
MKITLITIIMLTTSTGLFAQPTSPLDSLIIEGKAMLDRTQQVWQESEFLQTRAHFERLLSASEHQDLVNYYLALTDLRLVFFYMGKDNKDMAKQYVNEGIRYAEKATDLNPGMADAYSLLSSLVGNKIGLSPMQGMFLGPKSGHAMQKAMEIDPTNPRNYLIAGESAYHTPSMFGGGKDKAFKNLKRSIELFDSVKITNPLLPDWGQDEAYTWLGICYRDMGDTTAAIEQFNNALKVNPDYGWVRYTLLPALSNKNNAEKSQ